MRDLRRNTTDAENGCINFANMIRWYKFVREHVIGNYIADFVCREKALLKLTVVSIDAVSMTRFELRIEVWLSVLRYGIMRF